MAEELLMDVQLGVLTGLEADELGVDVTTETRARCTRYLKPIFPKTQNFTHKHLEVIGRDQVYSIYNPA